MKLIKFLISISWTGIAVAAVAGLIAGAANAYLLTLINGVVAPGPEPSVSPTRFAVTAVVVLLFGLASQLLLVKLAEDAVLRLREGLARGVLGAPLEHLERLGTHRLLATLTEDVRSLAQAVASIPGVCIDVATIIGTLTYLGIVSGPLFAISVGGTALGIMCVETVLRRVRETYRRARENEDHLIASFQEVTVGIKELKLHRGRRSDFMDRRLLGAARELRSQNIDAAVKMSGGQVIGQGLQLLTMALVLFLVARLLELPKETMVSYILVTTFLSMPMQSLMHRLPELVRGDVALAKVRGMSLSLQTMHDESELPFDDRPVAETVTVELDGVTFDYLTDPGERLGPPFGGPGGPGGPGRPGGPPGRKGRRGRSGPPPGAPGHRPPPGAPLPDVDGRHTQRAGHRELGPGHRPGPGEEHGERPFGPVPDGANPDSPKPHGFHLGPIDLTLRPGEVTFIVGGNGSGKSTLAKLLTGLYVPRDGTIAVNGVQIDHPEMEWFRQHTAAVFSDFHLFDDYLGFDRPDLDERVRELLTLLRIDHKVTVENGKLSTVALSQGQRKRLALLTAMLEDRPVYVFDEWAADQEPQFREVFYDEILPELRSRDKTVVVITHDDRYFDRADQLVKLDFGAVVNDQAYARSPR
jgi:putative ATP-binding cassette transporter